MHDPSGDVSNVLLSAKSVVLRQVIEILVVGNLRTLSAPR